MSIETNEQLEFDFNLYAFTEWEQSSAWGSWVKGFKYLTSKTHPKSGLMMDFSWAVVVIEFRSNSWSIRYYPNTSQCAIYDTKKYKNLEEAKTVADERLKSFTFGGFDRKKGD